MQSSCANMEIVVEVNSCELTGDNGTVGKIWMESPDYAFPEKEWWDFPVVILQWWIEKTVALARDEETGVNCEFMDGPYAFRLSKIDEEVLSCSCCDRRWSDDMSPEKFIEEYHLTTTLQDWMDTLYRAARKMLDHCARMNWSGKDIDRLAAGIKKLKR
ncbi:MAG: hypothetical protein HJJLKODD_01235 [Phycisphaerae bacterium]|nr:hypothetical protein [Phycisphaerae bacterium]